MGLQSAAALWNKPGGYSIGESGSHDDIEIDDCKSEDGEVYFDGCREDSKDKELAGAGWAAVQISDDEKLAKVMFGAVPCHLEQSAGNAEHLALLMGGTRIRDKNVGVFDCQAVISGWSRGYRLASGGKRPQAGLWRQVRREGTWSKIERLAKVKAHQNAEVVDDALAERRRKGR